MLLHAEYERAHALPPPTCGMTQPISPMCQRLSPTSSSMDSEGVRGTGDEVGGTLAKKSWLMRCSAFRRTSCSPKGPMQTSSSSSDASSTAEGVG